jgi:hypothetical protein
MNILSMKFDNFLFTISRVTFFAMRLIIPYLDCYRRPIILDCHPIIIEVFIFLKRLVGRKREVEISYQFH